MTCEGCGERIVVGQQYYHDTNADTNWDLGCAEVAFEEPERTMEIRWNDE